MKWLLYSLALLFALAVAALAWLVVVYPTRPPAKRASQTVALEIAPHTRLDAVAAQLGQKQLIESPGIFALYARVLGAQERLRAGRVLVTTQMTKRQLLQRIATGYGTTPLRITIPEGFSRFDVAARLSEWNICPEADFLRESATSEGYLFPDTYWLTDEMQPSQVAKKLSDNAVRRQQKLFSDEAAALHSLQRELGIGAREVVTLASIVEKEAHVRSEQPIIAGVFLNRLRDPSFKPKRLQADPTVAYGCMLHPELAGCQGFDGKRVTRTMTSDPQNPYNTYRIDGLPPGPIANPGISALQAVLHPAQHGYFYFVARGDGRHTFSASLAEHNVAVHGPAPTP